MQELALGARKTFYTYIVGLFKAHYKVAGQYTYPIQEDPKLPAKSISDFNIALQILLSPFVLLPAWLCSLIIIPIVGNTALNLLSAAKHVFKIALYDTDVGKNINTRDKRDSNLQKIYGILGTVIGAIGSILISCFIIPYRIVKESVNTGARTFVSIANALVYEKDKLNSFAELEIDDKRETVTKYGLGGPGFVISALLGVTFVAPVTVLGRVATNSAYTFAYAIRRIVNSVLIDKYDAIQDHRYETYSEDQQKAKRVIYGFGAVGLLLAAIIGPFIAVIVSSWIRAGTLLNSVNSLVLGKPYSDEVKERGLVKDKGYDKLSGILGYLIAALIIAPITIASIVTVRFIGNSILSFGYAVQYMVNRVLINPDKDKQDERYKIYKEAYQSDEEDQNRANRIIYGFGGPGKLLGWMVGAALAVIVSSWISAARLINTMNSAVLGKTDHQPQGLDKDTRNGLIKATGALGYVIAALLIGPITVACIFAARVIGNSVLSFGYALRDIVHSVLISTDKLKDDTRREKYQADANRVIYGFGGPGFFLGAIIGVAIAVFPSSIVRAGILLNSMNRAVLGRKLSNELEKKGLERDKDTAWYIKLLGIPGYLITALIIGPISVASIFAARVVGNSALTFIYTVGEIVNKVLVTPHNFQDERKQTYSNDQAMAKRVIYGFGGPGYILGGIVGSAIVVLPSSLESGRTLLNSMNRAVLGKSEGDKLKGKCLQDDNRKWYIKLTGTPGYLVVALFVGPLSVASIFTARVIGNSALSFIHTVQYMVNRVLIKRDEIVEYETRYEKHYDFNKTAAENKKIANRIIYGLGGPGKLLGWIIGAVIVVFPSSVERGRTLLNSMNSVALGEPYSAEAKTRGLDSDERSLLIKLSGIPGYLITALIIGPVCVASIFTVRSIKHSALTFYYTVRDMINSVLIKDKDNLKGLVVTDVPIEDPNKDKDTRENRIIYGLGILGFILAGIVGSVLAMLASSRESARTLLNSINRIVLSKSDGTELAKKGLNSDDRRWFVKLSGMPGYVITALVISPITVSLIVGARVTANSVLSFGYITQNIANSVLVNPYDLKGDSRDLGLIFGWGVLGSLLALIAGSAAALVAASFESAKYLLSNMICSVLHDKDMEGIKIEKEDDRHPAVKYLLGLPGGLLIFPVGLLGILVAGSGRFVTNTLKTARATFLTLRNAVLKDKYLDNLNLEKDKDRKIGHILLGSLGFILGGVAAVLAGILLLGKHTVVQTGKSWAALSGSIMNVALGEPAFTGLKGDEKRKGINKALGVLGYVAAVTITSIAALCVLAWKQKWVILVSIPAIILSPFTLLGKIVYVADNGHRFDSTNDDDVKIKRFKNLFSSLNPFGYFTPGEAVEKNGTGKKGPWSYVRKVLSFSYWTPTESAVNELLEEYKNKGDQADFAGTIARVKSKLLSAESEQEAQSVATFVEKYIKSDTQDVLVDKDIYKSKSLRDTFWGKADDNKQEQPAEAAATPAVTPL